VIVWKEFSFDSAHYLPNVPVGHKCGRMHGHTFKVRIEVGGPVVPILEWVVDFADIKEHVSHLVGIIDHAVLNDFAGLENPTSENIARWFWDRLSPALPLVAVEVQENCTSGVRYTG
jgi:6-pyruvoyltetrahydropterin/6-carboxytetrahydropterin synthase